MVSTKLHRQAHPQKPRILVAEDDPADRDLIRRALDSDDFSLTVVDDGEELLCEVSRIARTTDASAPALIILDLNMPRRNGVDVLRELRTESTYKVPVVVFSSSSRPKDVADCYEAGCSAYVVKPTDLEPFNQALEGIATFWLKLAKHP